eukprot:CAMPEP_0170602942 /NCGR_PEP_ID=MMETSP0224-20130122/18657_1 /TAXON_ID=285029 /ORGANISM="Togula jolla, Strain CCCM 725" /LENGTH=383 /DNA_ID=CAMNT_0010927809 /DNA_START=267 /DNA_END=1418 /DNA_ORIENTATION=-
MASAYLVAQLLAGIAAGFASTQLYGSLLLVAPLDPFHWWQAMVVEVIYTAMLVFVILGVTSIRSNPQESANQYFGLAIGLVLVAAGYAVGNISGAALNPAISIGLSFPGWRMGETGSWGFRYAIFEIIGGMLGSGLFYLCRPEDFSSRSEADRYVPTLPTKLAAEFIGTYVLVMTVGLNVLGKSPATAWSVAAALVSMIYALGDVSGAHFNPAVTVAVMASRKGCSLRDGLAYIVVQLAAALLAGLLYSGLFSSKTFPLAPKAPYGGDAAVVMEFIFTFLLTMTVLSTACSKGITSRLTRNYYAPLAIGSCVTAGGVASGAVSGGVLNPAVSFGIAVSHLMNDGHLFYFLTYSTAQVLAGLAAAFIFQMTHCLEYAQKDRLFH